MIYIKKRKDFINRIARIPHGEKAVKFYNEPKGHYKSFKSILEKLNLKQEDKYFEIGCVGGVLLGMALEKVKIRCSHRPQSGHGKAFYKE